MVGEVIPCYACRKHLGVSGSILGLINGSCRLAGPNPNKNRKPLFRKRRKREKKQSPMKNTTVFLARRILTNVNNPASRLRFYCSPPSSSSPPRNNKLFVGGRSLYLALSCSHHVHKRTQAQVLVLFGSLYDKHGFWVLQACHGRWTRGL